MRISPWENLLRSEGQECVSMCVCTFSCLCLNALSRGARSARTKRATSPLDLGFLIKRGSWIRWSLRPLGSSNISGFYVDSHCVPAQGCQMPSSSAVFSGLVWTHQAALWGESAEHPGRPFLASQSCSEEILYIPPQDYVRGALIGWFCVRTQRQKSRFWSVLYSEDHSTETELLLK